jgi:hypothetical protein
MTQMPSPERRVIRIGRGPACTHVRETATLRIEVWPTPATDEDWQQIAAILARYDTVPATA